MHAPLAPQPSVSDQGDVDIYVSWTYGGSIYAFNYYNNNLRNGRLEGDTSYREYVSWTQPSGPPDEAMYHVCGSFYTTGKPMNMTMKVFVNFVEVMAATTTLTPTMYGTSSSCLPGQLGYMGNYTYVRPPSLTPDGSGAIQWLRFKLKWMLIPCKACCMWAHPIHRA